jgi:serine/threonine-protein kinase
VQLATGRRVEIQRATGSTAERMRLKRALRDHVDVTHPGLVLPIDAGLDDKGLYVVYPDPGGQALDSALSHPLPVTEVIEFLRQMARMLGELHARGQHYGLLRPDCVRRVRAVDGTAHYLLVDVGLINTAFAVFDTEWAAPEDTVDSRSDIYALGHLAVRLLGGQVTGSQHTVPGDAPVGFTRLLMAMLATDPAQRPQSGAAVLQALSNPGRLRPDPRPELPAMSLTDVSGDSTFDRSVEAMTNHWRPLRRVAVIVIVGVVVMFCLAKGLLTLKPPAEVPHPSATTFRPDAEAPSVANTAVSLDASAGATVIDAGTSPLDTPDLAIVASPVEPIDVGITSPDVIFIPAVVEPMPAVKVAEPKAKKPRKRRRVRRRAPKRKRKRKRARAKKAKPAVTAPPATPYERL